ncbi:LutB/LldF family L-lactate oxidation iron-sulfur protein [Micromonospora sp. LAH09]|uniref:LutB/LldF family L-lactate oxidation iron-sulfur protein n=1 Tax=Micromonospora cabrerizensis TaxID=2911213 RepID=UPI001EE885E7|nr:LutB/LldF family L-lactate oxidation iron-sulfur protein [Micromonospora cabrerizensis]MCG5471733.1 LutB/LldF family L-lactate oxidation iron-sulfur protein [Micromonospora cabrerizensis]
MNRPVAPATGGGRIRTRLPFPTAARPAVADTQLRANLHRATRTIRGKRARVVDEVPDWEALRDAGSAIKADVQRRLPELLEQFEASATAAGATVHWARDAAEACRIVVELTRATGADEVVKVKSMATQEIELNEALEAAGIAAYETDLAELIVQLGDDTPSHILVPAIHYNRAQIREIFQRRMPDVPADLSDEPSALAEAARAHLRRRFLSARVAVSGANFAIADTGTLVVVESEGNGRMCLTLPETLISVVGVEKLLPTFTDLEVFLQLLPRSSTGERMNPYTSMWTGVTPGDGPQDVHVVLVDNGRSAVLADPVGRPALSCIRCSACLNVCPVYERAGGHAYGSVYPGPIGAILSPQLTGVADNASLPYASTLCGACYDVCPVKINIPEILVHLRQQAPHPLAERATMGVLSWVMRSPRRWAAALRLARAGAGPLGAYRQRRTGARTLRRLPWPASAWTRSRDLPLPAPQTFREWWGKQ